MDQKNKKKQKYKNNPRRVDGLWFQSKKEAQYYIAIKAITGSPAGPILVHRQVKFDLPGGVTYAIDFMEIYPWGIKYVDVKGERTKEYIRNKKMIESIYDIEIIEA